MKSLDKYYDLYKPLENKPIEKYHEHKPADKHHEQKPAEKFGDSTSNFLDLLEQKLAENDKPKQKDEKR